MSQRLTLYQALHVSKRTYIHWTKGRHELQVWKEGDMNLIKCIKLVLTIICPHEDMFVTTSCLLPLPITHSFPTHIHNQAQHEAAQAILASHFSRSWMSAEPVLPPLALHSRNSTLRGNCENSNSLPFFPSWAGTALELSSVLGAAERVTRKVFLRGKRQQSGSYK